MKPTSGDFTPGTTFGIQWNIRKAIVLERRGDDVLWEWVNASHPPTWDKVNDIIDVCTSIGDICIT